VNFQIITSSYPGHPDDPTGTAGLFVRDFAVELASRGHSVIVQPAARKETYTPDPGLLIEPTPWLAGDQELASFNYFKPANWWTVLHYHASGCRLTAAINRRHRIDRTLCMWVIPAGIFGSYAKLTTGVPYDVWALGSDIWRIRKIPFLGPAVIRNVVQRADRVYADGVQLSRDVKNIAGRPCEFLPSSRTLPPPTAALAPLSPLDKTHLLFVGRYHRNKGADLLVEAMGLLPEAVREQIRLHMFGVGPMKEQLPGMIAQKQLDQCIELHGPIGAQDYVDYLRRCAFLVIPSRIESIPLVFSDALQNDTPVVTTPVGDLTELIEQYGCGFVAEAPTAVALARSLQKALECAPVQLRGAVATAAQNFSVSSAVDRWLSLG